jgi:uncharacterized protein YciI
MIYCLFALVDDRMSIKGAHLLIYLSSHRMFIRSLLLFCLFAQMVGAQTNPAIDSVTTNPHWEEQLFRQYRGDEYGMKSYFFVLLKTGPNQNADPSLIREAFKGHLENINRLVETGQLIVAGPFDRNTKNYRGLFIFDKVASEAALRELLQTDPAIQQGLLEAEVFSWYGSAALPAYLPISDKIWKKKP